MTTTTFASIRIVTDDVDAMVGFYEAVTGIGAHWSTPVFAEIHTDRGTLAIAGSATMALFGGEVARAAANRSVIIELLVDDVDAETTRVRGLEGRPVEVVQEPTTMPWGNRSALLRDPDGSLVNLFTPVTDGAVEKFRR